MPGLPMLRIVILGIDPYPKPFKSKLRLLLKGFFNAPQLSKASFRRCVALKKPITL